MERYALLAWLLEVIQQTPDDQIDRIRVAPDRNDRFEAIELVWHGKVFLIRVDEVPA